MQTEGQIVRRDEQARDPREGMRRFIRNSGGEVRFDAFSREHILGEASGFYSQRIDLSRDHSPVATPMDHRPGYRAVYAALLLREARECALRNDGTVARIAEAGPGGGELRAAVQSVFQMMRDELYPLKSIEYVAIDPNPRHVAALVERGAAATIGTVQKMPFEDGSMDLFVAEEVLDTLPYRMLSWDRRAQRFVHETFVRLEGGDLRLIERPVERDMQINALERWLGSNGYDRPYYRYSPDYPKFWGEVRRVLSPQGIAFVSDYSNQSMVNAISDDKGHESMAVRRPYGVDLTHFIDFGLQEYIAKARGFGEISVRQNLDAFALGGGLGAALEVAVGGRFIMRASGKAVETVRQRWQGQEPRVVQPISTAELYAMGNGMPGVTNVLRALSGEPEASEVVEIFRKHGLRGGAFWTIYSDIANRDLRLFIDLVLREDSRAIEWAKSQMEPEDLEDARRSGRPGGRGYTSHSGAI